jgi:hypothetical protein
MAKLNNQESQNRYLNKAKNDFNEFVLFDEFNDTNVSFILSAVSNSINFNGKLILYNQGCFSNRIEHTGEGDWSRNFLAFNYREKEYSNFNEINVEEFVFTKGLISDLKLLRDKTILMSYSNYLNSKSEYSYYLSGKLVRTDFREKNNSYFYEFENGINLTLKSLEDKIKEADNELAYKNYDYAIELYKNCYKNDYPKTIALNLRIEKSIQNAESQKILYEKKLEQQRIAEEKRIEDDKLSDPTYINYDLKYSECDKKVKEYEKFAIQLSKYAKSIKNGSVLPNTFDYRAYEKKIRYMQDIVLNCAEGTNYSRVLKSMELVQLCATYLYSSSLSSSNSSTSNSSSNSITNKKKCTACKPSDDKGWYFTDYDYIKKLYLNGRYIKNIGHKPCSSCQGQGTYKRNDSSGEIITCHQCRGDRWIECNKCKGEGYVD